MRRNEYRPYLRTLGRNSITAIPPDDHNFPTAVDILSIVRELLAFRSFAVGHTFSIKIKILCISNMRGNTVSEESVFELLNVGDNESVPAFNSYHIIELKADTRSLACR